MRAGDPAVNVLLSAAGRRVHLLEIFQRSLRDLGSGGRVVAVDLQDLSAAWHRADASAIVPSPDAPEFEERILEICALEAVCLVVPTIDTELATYARLAARLAEVGVTVAVSSPAAVEIAASKRRTNIWLREHGFPVPRQWTSATNAATPTPHQPLIVKPDRGSSSIGVVRVSDEDALALALREPDVVVEELAPGVEHTVDVFVDREGRAHAAVPRRRLEVRAGEVSKGLTVHLPAVEALVIDIAEALPGARGCLNVQLFHDQRTDEVMVIEINARFGGGHPLTDRAGAPYATWLLEEALGRPSSIPSAPQWRPGTLMLRYDAAVFVDDWHG